jgi:AraC-like DNA-binding protein
VDMRHKDILQHQFFQPDEPYTLLLPKNVRLVLQTSAGATIKRHFKNEFGITMYQYYLQQKMVVARKLLEKDKLSVNDTAEMPHYASVSNFIETFRNYYGRTPGNIKAE